MVFSQDDEDPPEIYSDCDDIQVNNELIFDENIPAEFEEEVVTISDDNSEMFEIQNYNPAPSPHPRSILLPQSEAKFKQTLTVNRSLLKQDYRKLGTPSTPTTPSTPQTPTPASSSHQLNCSSKFRQTVNFKPTNFVLNEHTMKIFKNKIKAIHKRKAQAVAREKKQRPPKKLKEVKEVKVHHRHKKVPPLKIPKPNQNYIPQKPKPIVDPKNSGEIVRVEKAESDIEVDILSNSEEDLVIVEPPVYDELSGSVEEISVDDPDGSWANDMPLTSDVDDEETNKKVQELCETDHDTFELLESLEVPTIEIILEPSNVTNIERFIHSEFFLQRPTKTPERYLKIRNHILLMWTNSRPHYLSKTAARNGLKKCGDVNCISRIHSLLEQIGAINFNCFEVNWVRPLRDLYKIFQQNIKNKNQNARSGLMDKKARIRNSMNIFGAQDTNFTISHDDSIYNSQESSDSMINRIKSRTIHRTQFELVSCQLFTDNAPFQVSITLSCLFCLYFHSISSPKLEIMGEWLHFMLRLMFSWLSVF